MKHGFSLIKSGNGNPYLILLSCLNLLISDLFFQKGGHSCWLDGPPFPSSKLVSSILSPFKKGWVCEGGMGFYGDYPNTTANFIFLGKKNFTGYPSHDKWTSLKVVSYVPFTITSVLSRDGP